MGSPNYLLASSGRYLCASFLTRTQGEVNARIQSRVAPYRIKSTRGLICGHNKKENPIMKKLFVVFALLGAMLFVTSCHMLHGAGQDIEDAGHAVKHAAN